jgi:hypothetical protein
MTYYKVLNGDNRSCNGGDQSLVWSLPVQNDDGTWTPGEWMPEVVGKLELCSNGYHLADAEHLLQWLNATIYEAEPSAEMLEGDDKVVCRSVRLVKKMNWNDRIARLFACDCAERVLPIYEKDYPDDKRPRHAVETARLYAEGKATQKARAAAGAAAGDAAGSAARDAAGAAAGAAARDAAWDAAGDAAGAAARAAAGAAETKWQTQRLALYLKEAT